MRFVFTYIFNFCFNSTALSSTNSAIVTRFSLVLNFIAALRKTSCTSGLTLILLRVFTRHYFLADNV